MPTIRGIDTGAERRSGVSPGRTTGQPTGLISVGRETVMRSRSISDGQTAYDSGTGFWFGLDGSTPKLSIGNSAGHKVTWDGATLTVTGDITVEDGSITADKLDVAELSAITADMGSLTAGNIVLSEFIRSGQTAYDTGTGFWLGVDGATPKFSIGNSAGSHMTWDGTTLSIFDAAGADATIENLVFKGDDDNHQAIGQLIGSETSTSNGGGVDEWQVLRTIVTNFTGSFRLRVEVREEIGGGADTVDASWRLKNGAGTIVHTETTDSPTYVDTFSDEETVTTAGETWTIEGRSQTDLSTYLVETFLRDIEVRARVNHAAIT